jgi:hypothetical protein
MGFFVATGFDGTNWVNSVGFNFYVDGAVSTGVVPGRIEFATGTSTANRTARQHIYSDGLVVFNETGANADFRIEGDTRANLFMLDASAEMMMLDGGVEHHVEVKSANYTLTTADYVVVFTASATATLPSATGTGQTYRIVCRAGTLTIDGNGTDTIKANLTQTLTAGSDFILTDTASGIWE